MMNRCHKSRLKTAWCLVGATLLFTTKAFSTVTLLTQGAYLKDAMGALMPTNGLVLLVVSTLDSTFAPPTPTAFVSGDDIIIGRWDLSGTGEPGVLLDAVNAPLGGNWNAEDPLQLYWFPTLTLASTSPGSGTPFGLFRTNSTLDGSAPWVTPADGSTVSLIFSTTEVGGSNPPDAGYANFIVGGVAPPVILSLTRTSETNVVITWSAVSNLTYRVQHKSDLGENWSNLATDITATNSTASVVDSFSEAGQKYYRIQLVP